MPTPFEFLFQLTGELAAQLAPVNTALAKTEENFAKAKKGLQLFEAETGKMDKFNLSIAGLATNVSALSKGGALLTFDMADGLGAVVEVGKAAVDLIVDLGRRVYDLGAEMVHTAANAEDMNLALKLNVGAESVPAYSALADRFKDTRFSPGQIKTAMLPLLEAKVTDEKTLDAILLLGGDLAAKEKRGFDRVEEVTQTFRMMAVRREVNGRVLRSLGINEADYWKDMSDSLGVSVKEAKRRGKAGELDADRVMNIALHQAQEHMGGVIGLGAQEAGGTVNAKIEKLEALPGRFWAKFASTEGYERFSSLLTRILDAFDPDGPAGQRIIAGIKRVTDTVFGMISDLGNKDTINKIVAGFEVVVDVARTLAAVLKEGYGWAKALWGVSSQVMGVFTTNAAEERRSALKHQLVAGYLKAHPEMDNPFGGSDAVWRFADKWVDKMLAHGQNGAAGLAEGLRAGQGQVAAASAEVASCAVESVRKGLDAHSPSRLMARLGGYASEGFAVGVEGGGDQVEAAAQSAIVGPLVGAATGGGAGGGAGAVVVNCDVTINAGGSDAGALYDEFDRRLEDGLHRIFIRLGIASGAEGAS